MARTSRIYDDERPLPYLVSLARADAGEFDYKGHRRVVPSLQHLDLRGGEFTRDSQARLAAMFDWLLKAYNIRRDDVASFCLEITPLDPDQDFHLVGEHVQYRPDDWPARMGRTFHWIPVRYDELEKEYAWQR